MLHASVYRRGEIFIELSLEAEHYRTISCVTKSPPNLENDMEYEVSQNCGFRDADVKKECSLDFSSDFSNYSNNEGDLTLHLFLVLYCAY